MIILLWDLYSLITIYLTFNSNNIYIYLEYIIYPYLINILWLYIYIGNIEIGKDISLNELKDLNYFDSFIFCVGAQDNKYLNLPIINETNGKKINNINYNDINGLHSARNFVNWYNGHPDFYNYSNLVDLQSSTTAIVIGQGIYT